MVPVVVVVVAPVLAVVARALDGGPGGAGDAGGRLLLMMKSESRLREQVEQRDQEMGPAAQVHS